MLWERAMPATGRVARMAASYKAPWERAMLAVGAGHAREQKGAGIGALLVPEHKVARMAASYNKKKPGHKPRQSRQMTRVAAPEKPCGIR